MDKNLKLSLVFLLLFCGVAYGSPTTTISIPNTFVAATTIKSADTNSNNNEIQSKFNTHSHTDITQVGTITSGSWAGTKVSTQYGGTGQDFSAVASGATISFSGTGTLTTLAKPASGTILYLNGSTQAWEALPQGASGTILTSAGLDANPNFLPGNKLVQFTKTVLVASSSVVNAITSNDNIPQITDGTEIMTASITPTSASNVLKVDVVVFGADSDTADNVVAVFQDNTANAFAAGDVGNAAARIKCCSFTSYITSPTASSATTIKVRVGASSAGQTFTVNGSGGARKLGGVLTSSLTVSEIVP